MRAASDRDALVAGAPDSAWLEARRNANGENRSAVFPRRQRREYETDLLRRRVLIETVSRLAATLDERDL